MKRALCLLLLVALGHAAVYQPRGTWTNRGHGRDISNEKVEEKSVESHEVAKKVEEHKTELPKDDKLSVIKQKLERDDEELVRKTRGDHDHHHGNYHYSNENHHGSHSSDSSRSSDSSESHEHHHGHGQGRYYDQGFKPEGYGGQGKNRFVRQVRNYGNRGNYGYGNGYGYGHDSSESFEHGGFGGFDSSGESFGN